MAVIEANKARLNFEDVQCSKDVAKLSIVGAGMMSNPGVGC